MASKNTAILIGRTGQDPKVAYLPNGNPVAEFTLATDESYKGKDGQKVEQTEWHRIKVFGKAAEFCAKWVAKGKLILVEGSIKTRSWEQDGQKRYMTEIVVSGPQHKVDPIEWPDKDAQPKQEIQPRQGDEQGPAFPSEASGMDDVPF